VESQLSLKNLDPSLLMWDMRRGLNLTPLPKRRCTIQFHYPELPPSRQNWWLVIDPPVVDLCSVDPGFAVDLTVTGALHSMTAVWMGLASLRQEVAVGRIELLGDVTLARLMQDWLGLSPFAGEQRRVS
jgi:hypothetical protein